MRSRVRWTVWAARARTASARRPWIHRVLAGAAAALAAVQVHAAVSRADDARVAWGEVRRVWVTTIPIDAGAPLVVQQRDVPAGMVPGGALVEVADGASAAHAMAPGAVVTMTDVRTSGDTPDGWLVVVTPSEQSASVLPGTTVVVTGASGTSCEGRSMATDGTRAEVAVPSDCARALTADLLTGDVVVARVVG